MGHIPIFSCKVWSALPLPDIRKMNILENYSSLISAIGAITLIQIIQLVLADIIGIRSKHTPGATVKADHDNLLFRASRVFANTNETISIFILASIFCVLVNASPNVTGIAAWTYVIARVVYAFCYYANFRTIRSIIFGISLLSLIVLYMAGVYAWF